MIRILHPPIWRSCEQARVSKSEDRRVRPLFMKVSYLRQNSVNPLDWRSKMAVLVDFYADGTLAP